MPESYLIGIAGPSGAGKTYLAQHLAQELNGLVLPIDAYYHDLAHLPPAIDHRLLIKHVSQLLRGELAEVPRYDFATHTRMAGTRTFGPAGVIIIEGLFALYWPEMRELLHSRIYVDMSHDVCFERRLARDVTERGRSPESVHQQYWTTVAPMAERHVYPMKVHADVVVWGAGPAEEHIARIREHMSPDFVRRGRK